MTRWTDVIADDGIEHQTCTSTAAVRGTRNFAQHGVPVLLVSSCSISVAVTRPMLASGNGRCARPRRRGVGRPGRRAASGPGPASLGGVDARDRAAGLDVALKVGAGPAAEVKHPLARRQRVDAHRDRAQRRDQSFQHVFRTGMPAAGRCRDAASRPAVRLSESTAFPGRHPGQSRASVPRTIAFSVFLCPPGVGSIRDGAGTGRRDATWHVLTTRLNVPATLRARNTSRRRGAVSR